MELEVVEDKKDVIITRDETGQIRTLYKIDKKELEEDHKKRIRQIADCFKNTDIQIVIITLRNCINIDFAIVEWIKYSTEVTLLLKKLYDKIDKPNILYYMIKNIDPEIYGKANTFKDECLKAYNIFIEVANEMINNGKLESVNSKIEKVKKIEFIVDNDKISNKVHDTLCFSNIKFRDFICKNTTIVTPKIY